VATLKNFVFKRHHFICGIFPFCMTSIFLFYLTGKFLEDTLLEFGSSKELIKSAIQALKGKTDPSDDLWTSIQAAYQIASYKYESGTGWGTKVSVHMVNMENF
jgi:hypothetical protein